MATARNVIEGSMRLLGVLASGESANAAEGADGLSALNALLESWSVEGLIVPNTVREEFTLTGGDGSYTMGSGANFNTARPFSVDHASIEIDGSPDSEIPLHIVKTAKEWAEITAKDLQSTLPTDIYFEGTYANETVNLYPVPSAACTLVIYSKKPLTSLASLNTTVTLPPGYERALRYNLAIEYGPEFGKSVAPEILKIAEESKAAIQNSNLRTPTLSCDDAFLPRPRTFNIYTGGFD